MQIAFVVLIEAVIPTFVTFACLTVAWLCVAMGMRKISEVGRGLSGSALAGNVDVGDARVEHPLESPVVVNCGHDGRHHHDP